MSNWLDKARGINHDITLVSSIYDYKTLFSCVINPLSIKSLSLREKNEFLHKVGIKFSDNYDDDDHGLYGKLKGKYRIALNKDIIIDTDSSVFLQIKKSGKNTKEVLEIQGYRKK